MRRRYPPPAARVMRSTALPALRSGMKPFKRSSAAWACAAASKRRKGTTNEHGLPLVGRGIEKAMNLEPTITLAEGEPDVRNKDEWILWCMRKFKTIDRQWCIQRWVVTASSRK